MTTSATHPNADELGRRQDSLTRRGGDFAAMLSAILLVGLLTSCGVVHPTIYAVDVSPATASFASGGQNPVTFTATGVFGYRTIRTLEPSDGLVWSSSDPSAAAIDAAGTATCIAASRVTITASVPVHAVKGTSPTVTGQAQLTCS